MRRRRGATGTLGARDPDGVFHPIFPMLTFGGDVALAFDEIRQFGATLHPNICTWRSSGPGDRSFDIRCPGSNHGAT